MLAAQTQAPAVILDNRQIAKATKLLAKSILARHNPPLDLALIGVHGGGDLLVRKLERALSDQFGRQLSLDRGMVDISFYRDDFSRLSQFPSLQGTHIPFDVQGRHNLLVDDVIFTGRTVRAALDAIFSLGRPARVELAALVDRGHREFPIRPDYVGMVLDTLRHQSINVVLSPDGEGDLATLEDHKYQE